MSGLKENSRKKVNEMNWIQIDEILWDMISKWNGKKKTKDKLIKDISVKFNWTDKQTMFACNLHFNMYDKVKK